MFVGIQRGGVLQAVDLRIDLAGHLWIAVADRNGQDAAEEIQVLAAFQVPQVLHFAAVRHQRPLVVIGHRRPEILLVLGDYLIAAYRGWHWLGRSCHGLTLTGSVECIEFSGYSRRPSNAIAALEEALQLSRWHVILACTSRR